MQIQSPELLNQLAVWRQKSADGTITLDEMREAIKVLRGNRMSAVVEAGAAKKAASRKPVSAAAVDSMLDTLKGL